MSTRFDVVTFDCYGTLIDWEEGIASAFQRLGQRQGWSFTREGILAAYSEVEPVVEGESYRSYRDVLAESARRVARTFGVNLPAGSEGFLAESLPTWRPFDDTNRALERLRSLGLSLGILSNIDDDLLAETLRHFTVPFEFVITAESVGAYKPELNHFMAAREAVGGRAWLHAAQSYFHDVVPARAMNIPTVWVNRHGSAPELEVRPDREVRNLDQLADLLSGTGSSELPDLSS